MVTGFSCSNQFCVLWENGHLLISSLFWEMVLTCYENLLGMSILKELEHHLLGSLLTAAYLMIFYIENTRFNETM